MNDKLCDFCRHKRQYILQGKSLGNFQQILTLIETIMCIFSFYRSNNYPNLKAGSLFVRLMQTHMLHRSPPGSLAQRSMQPV